MGHVNRQLPNIDEKLMKINLIGEEDLSSCMNDSFLLRAEFIPIQLQIPCHFYQNPHDPSFSLSLCVCAHMQNVKLQAIKIILEKLVNSALNQVQNTSYRNQSALQG